jgi:ATP-dependent helicase/nuclease subunit A
LPITAMRLTESFCRFNDGQRHALDGNRNLAVRANAGSGKTSVLVERVVQLLARNWDRGTRLNVSAVVALTFTRKAAAELQDRLRAAFVAMIELAGNEQERAYWAEQVEELSRASIGTIDGFCARVLREFGYAADAPVHVEPDFEPLEDYDEAALKREAVERVVNHLSSPPPWEAHPATLAQAAACCWWGEAQGYDALTRHLTALLDHIVDPEMIRAAHAELPPAAERVRQAWEQLPAVRRLHEDRPALAADLQALIKEIDNQKRPGQRLSELRGHVGAIRDALAAGNRPDDERALKDLRTALFTLDGEPRKQGLAAVAGRVQPLQQTWGPLLEQFEFDWDGEVCALEAADRLALLLAPAHAEYLQLCHEDKRFDFLTLARRTRDLLRGSVTLRTELKDRYRYVLVDEFQDTNQLQWDIIAALVRDESGQSLDPDRLFIVGDPQQSIYRFRHADVGVFSRVQEQIRDSNRRHGRERIPTDFDGLLKQTASTPEQRLGLMPLGANYRTLAPVPLGLLDEVFRYVFDPAAHGLDLERNRFEVRYQPLIAGQGSAAEPVCGEVYYLIPKEEEAEETDDAAAAGGTEDEPAPAERLSHRQVRAVVDRLQALRGQPRLKAKDNEPRELTWSDMAVLLPSRSLVLTELEKEFRRRGVPFVVTRGIGFWQRQEVRDVVNLAACLADAGDELSLFAVLRGPIGQRSDTEILFLSQLGQGSIGQGLRLIEHAGDRLPEKTQQALADYWQALSAEAKERLRTTAGRAARWRRRVDRMAHADLLQRALDESGAYAIYAADAEGEAMLANLRRLFDLIRAYEDRSAPGLARLARRLCALVEESLQEEQATPDAVKDAVQVMTVHAAKGLEFPVVAVLKMERKADRGSRQRLMVKSPWDDLLPEDVGQFPGLRPGTVAVSVRHPRRPREMYTPRLLHALRRLDRAQEVAEARRLFYVAATRAQERLILVGKQFAPLKDGRPAHVPESWQKWFEDALGLTDAHKRQGFWENAAKGHRVTIITEPSDAPPAAVSPPDPVDQPLDLQPIHEPPCNPVISVARLLAMREAWHKDRREWRLRYRLHLQPRLPDVSQARSPLTEFDGWLLDPLIGTLVYRLLTLPRMPSRAAEQQRLLLALAANLLTAESCSGADAKAAAELLADPDVLTAIAETAGSLVQSISASKTGGPEVRRLLTAEGESDVSFCLRLGRWHVVGAFGKLLRKSDGYELIDWSAGLIPESEQLGRSRLLALALHRSGRAALADGKVGCHVALLHRPAVETLALAPGELDLFAEELTHELEEMDVYMAE